ncbi:MAG: 50S ribosomal protein L21 [Candidatus Magasanikbacteria bacterium RIFCSPLOWO2_02_FULL_43_22]|nr:MAG: 50S ribosomal protein L21 [Candidatus Magasanikbacteria bacterium RIFCSPLOWO2_02_FULL_43_22]
MFSVIETGGKQYLVKSGETLRVEKLNIEDGKEFVFDKVLLTANEDGTDVKIGNPYLSDIVVKATVLAQGRAKKISVVKYKRKVRYHKVHGHRQSFTKVKID